MVAENKRRRSQKARDATKTEDDKVSTTALGGIREGTIRRGRNIRTHKGWGQQAGRKRMEEEREE